MEESDHKKLGPELELFYIDQEVGRGLPMFLPKGAIIKRELERFVIEEEVNAVSSFPFTFFICTSIFGP